MLFLKSYLYTYYSCNIILEGGREIAVMSYGK